MLANDGKRVEELARRNKWGELSFSDFRVLCEIAKEFLPKKAQKIANLSTGFVEERMFFDTAGMTRKELITQLKKALKKKGGKNDNS